MPMGIRGGPDTGIRNRREPTFVRQIELYPEHLRKRFREWFDAVSERLNLSPVADDH